MISSLIQAIHSSLKLSLGRNQGHSESWPTSELCHVGLVEIGEKKMLGEGDIRGKGSGMTLHSIESPPGTRRDLIKWKVGRDGTGGWRQLVGQVLFHGHGRHTALRS